MTYQAKSNGNGTYTIFQNGIIVQGAKVKSISFPGITSHTLHGSVHHIAGPCVASISVPGQSQPIEDVQVVF